MRKIYSTPIYIRREEVDNGYDIEAFMNALSKSVSMTLSSGANGNVWVGLYGPLRIENGLLVFPKSFTLNITAIQKLNSGGKIDVPLGPVTGRSPEFSFNPGSMSQLIDVDMKIPLATEGWTVSVGDNKRYTFSKFNVKGEIKEKVPPAALIEAFQTINGWYGLSTNGVLNFSTANRVLSITKGTNFPADANAPLVINTY